MVRKAVKKQRSKQTDWGLDPTHVLFFCSLTMHELRNRKVSIGKLHEHTLPPFVFCQVLCRVNSQNSKQKHTTKRFVKFPNHFPMGGHGCPKHELWRVFVDGAIDTDKTVASSKKHKQFKTRVLKTNPFRTKLTKIDTISMTSTAENLWAADTYTVLTSETHPSRNSCPRLRFWTQSRRPTKLST